MKPNEGANASSADSTPLLEISSSAAICCLARITERSQVEILAFNSVTRDEWSRKTRIQLPSESGKTAKDLGCIEPEDPSAIVTRCFETEVLVAGARLTDLVRPIDGNLTSLDSVSESLTPIISWCVRADRGAGQKPSLHRKDVFAFLAVAGLDSALRRTAVDDTDRRTKRSETLQPPRWIEARTLVGEMQTLHGPVAHAVAVLQMLRILARIEYTGAVAQEYNSLLEQREFLPLTGDPTSVAEYIVRHRLKLIPQPK